MRPGAYTAVRAGRFGSQLARTDPGQLAPGSDGNAPDRIPTSESMTAPYAWTGTSLTSPIV